MDRPELSGCMYSSALYHIITIVDVKCGDLIINKSCKGFCFLMCFISADVRLFVCLFVCFLMKSH